MKIDWWTLALQAVNFVVLVWLLWRFLYRPVRQVIEKRQALAGQAFADADQRKSEAEVARRQFEEDRAGLAQERRDLLKKLHEELETERQKVLAEAKNKADEMMEEARKALAEERAAALAELRNQAADLSVELASRLLREAGPDASGGVFLKRIEKRLEDLPADERERLEKDLEVGGARLTVVTAAPLKPAIQEHWTDRLAACLGHRDAIDFGTDPEVLGGAELRFPHAVLKITWADQLQRAKELLRSDEADS